MIAGREWRDAERDAEEEHGMADRCLHVYDIYGGETRLDASDEPMLRQAIRDYLESGKDAILDMTTVWGADCAVLLSAVKQWIVSTAETRARSRICGRAAEQANKKNDLIDGGGS